MSVTIVPGQKLTEMPAITAVKINDLFYTVAVSNDTSYSITLSALGRSIIPALSNYVALLDGVTMTGHMTLTGVPLATNDAATKGYVDTLYTNLTGLNYLTANYLPLSGGTMTGNIRLTGAPLYTNDAANKGYVDTMVPLAGGTMTGPLYLNGNPTLDNQAVNKAYVDGLSSVGTSAVSKVFSNVNNDSCDTNTNCGRWVTYIADGNGKLRSSGLFGSPYNGGNGAFQWCSDEFRPSGIQFISTTEKALSVISTFYTTWVLSNSGRVYSTGYNAYGQLGLNTNQRKNIFVNLSSINAISQITVNGGDYGSKVGSPSTFFAITSTGVPYGWGSNSIGQLGFANTKGTGPANGSSGTNYWNPTLISVGDSSNKVSRIVTTGLLSFASTYAILTSGQLYAAGYNANGQLGLGNYANKYIFTLVPGVSCEKIFTSSRGQTTYALSGGYLSAAGDNTTGQLGLGTTGAAAKFDNTTFKRVLSSDNSGNIGPMVGVDYISVNDGYSGLVSVAALTKNKELYVWGYNGTGALGTGDKLNRSYATKIGTADKVRMAGYGGATVMVILTGTDMYTTGYIRWGVDGQGDSNDKVQTTLQVVPRPQGVEWRDFEIFSFDTLNENKYIIATDAYSNIWGWGSNVYSQMGIRSVGRGGISQPDFLDYPTAITVQLR